MFLIRSVAAGSFPIRSFDSSPVFPKDFNAKIEDARLCKAGSLDPKKVKEKIVVCLRGISARVEKGEAVREAGGVAMILANDEGSGNEIIADPHVLPASHLSFAYVLAVFAYVNSTKKLIGAWRG